MSTSPYSPIQEAVVAAVDGAIIDHQLTKNGFSSVLLEDNSSIAYEWKLQSVSGHHFELHIRLDLNAHDTTTADGHIHAVPGSGNPFTLDLNDEASRTKFAYHVANRISEGMETAASV